MNITRAVDILRQEAAGLVVLADHLGADFDRAVELLASTRGRVVVTGMGKSGHIGSKIASTLASTGTPALFVHPAEASHGDLGMITAADSIVALSNSGETSEMQAIVAYARRCRLSMVAITKDADSTLARLADVVLGLPAVAEACPLGLTPTTSTTMMLALGDALAITLFERRGFSAKDFHDLHPGGRLGQQLLAVSDLMHHGEALPLVVPAASMSEVVLEMTSKRLGCVAVVGGTGDEERLGRLEGIITDGDLRRHMGPDLLACRACDVMSLNPQTIEPDAWATDALRHMSRLAITQLLVVEGWRLVGILHIHDCIRAGLG